MSDETFLAAAVLILLTVVIVVILIQGGSLFSGRMARREQARERELIGKYETLAGHSAQHQETTSTELKAIRERLDAIETLLREVE